MDTRGSAHIVRSNKHFESGQCCLYVLPESGHRMNIENPYGMAELLINDIYGHSKGVFTPREPTIQYLGLDGNALPE